MSGRRAGTLAVAGVLATTLLVVVLAVWAASIGPSEVLRGGGPAPTTRTPSAVQSASGSTSATDATDRRREPPAWVRVLATVLDVAAAIAVGALLLRLLLPLLSEAQRRRRSRREARRRGVLDEPEFEVMEPPAALAREILADAAVQRRTLEEGAPRNAVVACWHRFEAHGAAAGVARHPWETSSEYTLRLLDLVDAHQPAVSRLAELYREARFSEHDVTEADRRAAGAALEEIYRTIGARA